jgi:hypothetical protein
MSLGVTAGLTGLAAGERLFAAGVGGLVERGLPGHERLYRPLGHRHVIQKLVEALGNLGGQELGVQPGARIAITRRHGLRLPICSWDKRIPATFILIG